MQTQNCSSCHFQDGNVLHQGVCPQPASSLVLFFSMIEAVFQSQSRIADPCRRVRAPSDPCNNGPGPEGETYDFVVVGGGVGGSVVASRLTEIANFTVLVIEAGPEQPSVISVPTFQQNGSDTSYDWQYVTVPQKRAFLSSGGICKLPRGKMLCGSTCLSGYTYARGSPAIYNDWGRNNSGWRYNEVLYYFKKSENNIEPPDLIDKQYHGFEGPVPVGRYPYNPPQAATVLQAFREVGFRQGDVNGRNQTGVTYVPAMIEEGVMISPERAYLRPHLRRPNLHILINTLATRITFDNTGTRATGVEYRDSQRKPHRVRASKEVIVCAGAYESPKLLLLSGVGPTSQLRHFKIRVVRDLPVGGNLNNHVSVSVNVSFADGNNNLLTESTLKEYINRGTGPFSSYGLNGMTVFAVSKYATRHNVPDIQINFDGYYSECEDCNELVQPGNVIFRPVHTLSTCRGTVKLKSANPYDKPLIDPNYLCNEKDVLVLYEALKLIRNVTQTKAFRPKLLQWDAAKNKNCSRFRTKTDPINERYWTCVIRQYTLGENHPGGTCKMGPVGDPAAVVDNKLRVHGIPNLRVADASIFPSQPNSNIVSVVIMVAEKAANMIKAVWLKTSN